MKFSLSGIGTLVLCISFTTHAAASDASPATAASNFVNALQQQHFKEAAAMFAPGEAHDVLSTERILKKIDETVGGFAAMHAITALPDGKSISLKVSTLQTIQPEVQKFLQFRYASTAGDGLPVFYELNLSADDTPPHVLSFNVHFSASGSQSTARANKLISLIRP